MMTDESKNLQHDGQNELPEDSVTWGPILFYGVFVAALVFFWWLAIYSHGVTPAH
jgi:hypothetical protein